MFPYGRLMGSALIAVVDSAKMQRTPVRWSGARTAGFGRAPPSRVYLGACDELAADTRDSIEDPTGARCERATISLRIAGRPMEIAIASTEDSTGRENGRSFRPSSSRGSRAGHRRGCQLMLNRNSRVFHSRFRERRVRHPRCRSRRLKLHVLLERERGGGLLRSSEFECPG